jgi:hypothetical protein
MAQWSFPPTPDSQCPSDRPTATTISALNILVDLLILLLPIPVFIRLRQPLRLRAMILGLFGLGIVVIAAGIVRTYYTWKSQVPSYDVAWEGFGLWMAGTIEVDVGLVGHTHSTQFSSLRTSCYSEYLD